MGYAVLENAQGADDGTVHTSEHQGEDYQKCNDRHVQGHYGGEELYFGHPSQPAVQGSGEIQQEQGDAHPEDDGQDYSQFF